MNDTLMIISVDVSFVKTASDLRNVHAPSVDSAFAKKLWIWPNGCAPSMKILAPLYMPPASLCLRLCAASCAYAYRAGRMRAVLGPAALYG